MDTLAIELIRQVELNKENCEPLIYEQGTILKVLMKTPTSYLVSDDANFNFTVLLSDEDKVWRKL